MTTAYTTWLHSLDPIQRRNHERSREYARRENNRIYRERMHDFSLEEVIPDRQQPVENQNHSALTGLPYHPAKEV